MSGKRQWRGVHGILLLDKPAGGSSNYALQKVRRLFNARKAGHTGSLDPLATGMLPVCFGEATKVSAFLLDADKGYEVRLKFGQTTDSADADGEIIASKPLPEHLDIAGFREICEQFCGTIQQIPPMVSAIKIDGQRLYKLAREGKTVERQPRTVSIHSLEVLSYSPEYAQLTIRCSKGTYIRSLVTAIGDAIGCGAHVASLRRSFVSPFEQGSMVSLEALQQMIEPLENLPIEGFVPSLEALDALLLPMDAALGHLPAVSLDERKERGFTSGQSAFLHEAPVGSLAESQMCRVYSESGLLLGLGEIRVATGESGLEGAAGCLIEVAPRRVFQLN
ncbi:MAG: tRNA pseudouridine(55) synthase TruB [Granulosicoccus sp.]